MQRSWPTWTIPDGRGRRPWTGWRRGIRLALEAVDEMATLVESLTQRVEALEAAQTTGDAAGDHTSDAPDAEGRGLRLFNWRRRRQAHGEEESDG